MFYDIWKELDFDEISSKIYAVTDEDVVAVLSKKSLSIDDLPVLLSVAAENHLEEMAERAAIITKERFGNTIQLYAPLYLSNECGSGCTYCGFSAQNKSIIRRTLTVNEMELELKAISDMGIKHTLLLCGEAPAKTSVDYLVKAAQIARRYMSYVAVEIYPMDETGYKTLVDAGVDGLTIYQETYNKDRYAEVHIAGQKKDMQWRMNAPDRGATAGMSTVGVGALLGLSNPRTDTFFAILHAAYLTKHYWRSNITISAPRMRQAEGCGGFDVVDVNDKTYVQFMLVARLMLPDAGIVVSTRETAEFRDNLLGLGVTQMSAASVTEPGGYFEGVKNISTAQFQVEDSRTVAEFTEMLKSKGYDPMVKNWDDCLSSKV